MNQKDVLEREITGNAVFVSLGDKDYPLTFPIHNVTLYGQETAKLNCRRAKEARDAGRPVLSKQEARAMRVTFHKLGDERLAKQAEFRRAEGQAAADLISDLQAISEEMVAIDVRLCEEVGTGDSLFKVINWWKIRDDDPERSKLAVWCGLHAEVAEGKWESPFSLAQLDKLVDFSNISEVLAKVTLSLAQYLPRTDTDKGPKAERPVDAAQPPDVLKEPPATVLQ